MSLRTGLRLVVPAIEGNGFITQTRKAHPGFDISEEKQLLKSRRWGHIEKEFRRYRFDGTESLFGSFL